MAVYSTDFSGYSVGSLPSDWTNRFDTTAGQITVEERAGSVSGKVLATQSHTESSVYVGASWNALDADADRADFEVVSIFTLRGADVSDCYGSTFGRGSGAALSSATLISAGVSGFATSTAKRISKRVSGTSSTVSSTSYSPSQGTRIGSRFRVSGTTVQARIWEYDNEAEPETWVLTGTVSNVSGAGWIGVIEGAFTTSAVKGPIEWEWFSVATGTDSATLPTADTTAPTLTSPTGTATGAITASGTVSTDEGNGTLYWLASANATETVATVQDGANQAVSATGVQTVTVSGLTASTAYYLHYVHTDAAGLDSDVATSAQFTTSEAGSPPAGTVTISAVDPDVTSAVVTYSYDDTDHTGFEYRLYNGTPAALGTSPATLSGLSESTGYDIQVRAISANGAGAWSDVFTFVTDALPTTRGVALTLHTGSTPQANISGIQALWWDTPAPGEAPAYSTITASTDAAGTVTIDLDASTSLGIGDSGFLLLYKLDGTDHQNSLVFAGQVQVVDVS